MALSDIQEYLKIVPVVINAPRRYLWSSYDAEADVLYINFKKPSHATDSKLIEDDVIVRYEGDEVVGLTVLRASQRSVTQEFAKTARDPISKTQAHCGAQL